METHAAADEEPQAAAKDEQLACYFSGQEVCAFFSSNDDPEGHRFVKVKQQSDAFPLIGLSAGWLRGTVREDFRPEHFVEEDMRTHVRINFSGAFRDTRCGAREGLERRVRPGLVRGAPGEAPAALLALLCVRWWDYWSRAGWSDCDPTSDAMLLDLFDGPCGVDQVLPGEYEVHTAWVRRSDDLASITGEEVRARLQAPNVSAWYFLQPSMRLDADSRAGCVCEFQFFGLCQRVERAGVPSGWPHIAHLYRLLAGKFWVPQMCLHPDYKLPATTRVHYAEFAEDNEGATKRAIGALLDLRRSAGPTALPAAAAGTAETVRGLVKLGFARPGDEEELPFCGPSELEEALRRLLCEPESNQIVCLVQDLVPNVCCELRVLLFHDAVGDGDGFAREHFWARPRLSAEGPGPPGAATAPATSADGGLLLQAEALQECFGGSEASMREAEEQANALVEHWLLWFCAECPEPPQVARFDFWVARGPDGQAAVWTADIGGACSRGLCGLEPAARSAAVLNGAMRYDETGRFPKPLPALRRRGGGAGA